MYGKTTIREGAASTEGLGLVVVSVQVLLKVCLGSVHFLTSVTLEDVDCWRRLGGMTGGLLVRADRRLNLLGLSGTVTGCDGTVATGGAMGDLYMKV